jgi:hypothetical protein
VPLKQAADLFGSLGGHGRTSSCAPATIVHGNHGTCPSEA